MSDPQVDDKVRVLSETAKLTGEELTAYLERNGLPLAELEQWRLALDEEGRASKATTKRIRKLECELARKEKALAEAAALLILKKKWRHCWRTRTTTRTRRARNDPAAPRRGASGRCAAPTGVRNHRYIDTHRREVASSAWRRRPPLRPTSTSWKRALRR